MSFTIYTDSTDGFTFEPEYNFRQRDRKIETVHRTRGGFQSQYIHGNYRRWKIEVRYVNSGDKQKVNSWWGSGARLLFQDDNAPTVPFGVRLVNRDLPVSRPERPYDYEWRGLLELEEF